MKQFLCTLVTLRAWLAPAAPAGADTAQHDFKRALRVLPDLSQGNPTKIRRLHGENQPAMQRA